MNQERRDATMPKETAQKSAEENSAAQKSALRRELLANRQAIDAEVRRGRDAVISRRVIAWCRQHQPACLGIFIPIRGEPDLMEAYKEVHAAGTRLALPVVMAPESPLAFVSWAPGEPLSKDAFGVPVPVSGELLQPDALLIPCVGFDDRRFRLGYGGGFYDRTLALSPRPVAIGIAYACMKTVFEPSPYDVPMDTIITDGAA